MGLWRVSSPTPGQLYSREKYTRFFQSVQGGLLQVRSLQTHVRSDISQGQIGSIALAKLLELVTLPAVKTMINIPLGICLGVFILIK